MVLAVVKKDGAGKRRSKQNGAKKHSEEIKGTKLKISDERRIMGRFAKRFSGERPVSLGFEFVFLPSLSELVWRVLDRDAKRRACISQALAKEPFGFFR